MSADPALRRYWLAPLDRQGVLMGLGWTQLAVIATGGAVTTLLLAAGVFVVAALVPLGASAGVAYGRVGDRRIVDWARPVTRAAAARRCAVWRTPTPWMGDSGQQPDVLAGIEISDRPLAGGHTGAVVWDPTEGTAAAVLGVPGADFALLDEDEQHALLDGWGSVLATYANSTSPVVRICWTEIANRTSLDHHLGWLAATGRDVDPAARRAYTDRLRSVAPETTRHDVFLTVVVGARRLRRRSLATTTRSEHDQLLNALRRSVTSTLRGLHNAGLPAAAALNRDQLGAVLRETLDPATALAVAPRSGALGSRLGLDTSSRLGPHETRWEWKWWETDRCLHRTYHVAEWPRHPVDGAWLTDVLTHAVHARRMTVVIEPMSAIASHRRIDRELTKLDTDALVREEHGKRITASWRRTRTAVTTREEELVAGFPETNYVGLVTLSASSVEGLEADIDDFEGAAVQAGIELQPLDGQHDLGWAATLPLGLGVARSGWLE